jgi:hypothetical protein
MKRAIRIIQLDLDKSVVGIFEAEYSCFFRADGTMTIWGSNIINESISMGFTLKFEDGFYNDDRRRFVNKRADIK